MHHTCFVRLSLVSKRPTNDSATWADITFCRGTVVTIHLNVSVLKCHINVRRAATSFKQTKIRWNKDWNGCWRTDQFCPSVAGDEAGASLRCYFTLCLLLTTVELETFLEICFYCFSLFLFFFFVNDAVTIKHLTGVNINICRWFWALCPCFVIQATRTHIHWIWNGQTKQELFSLSHSRWSLLFSPHLSENHTKETTHNFKC